MTFYILNWQEKDYLSKPSVHLTAFNFILICVHSMTVTQEI